MKKLLTIAMITLAAMAAKADLYLYWTVAPNAWEGVVYATVFGIDASSSNTALGGIVVNGTADSTTIALGSGLDNITYTNYWVQLYDSAMSEIAKSSDIVTFDQLASSVWDSTVDSKPSSTPFEFSGFTSTIPEPTSGLMLLLGLGALALKRKHV